MKARTAKQFAEVDESMTSDASPLAQHAARQYVRDAAKPHPADLTSRLLNIPGDDDEDVTTDFRNLVRADESLLMEGNTPDISQLMAQTPMKLGSSGNWERPPPKQTEPVQAPAPTRPEHIPLASLRMRAPGSRPAPPRTPPRREEESFEGTPRAGYTFEVTERDTSLEGVESGGEVPAILASHPSAPIADESLDTTVDPDGNREPHSSEVEDARNSGDEMPEFDLEATRMKAFTVRLLISKPTSLSHSSSDEAVGHCGRCPMSWPQV